MKDNKDWIIVFTYAVVVFVLIFLLLFVVLNVLLYV